MSTNTFIEMIKDLQLIVNYKIAYAIFYEKENPAYAGFSYIIINS